MLGKDQCLGPLVVSCRRSMIIYQGSIMAPFENNTDVRYTSSPWAARRKVTPQWGGGDVQAPLHALLEHRPGSIKPVIDSEANDVCCQMQRGGQDRARQAARVSKGRIDNRGDRIRVAEIKVEILAL